TFAEQRAESAADEPALRSLLFDRAWQVFLRSDVRRRARAGRAQSVLSDQHVLRFLLRRRAAPLLALEHRSALSPAARNLLRRAHRLRCAARGLAQPRHELWHPPPTRASVPDLLLHARPAPRA